MTGRLGPIERRDALRQMADEPLDLLVIGGGVTGAGTALDAASRGLRVGLVEARDLAGGTSSWSSKLIHGGLRYLERLDFRLVREALRERGLLLRTLAPHLVRPVPFLFPLRHRLWERPYIGAGVLLYDLLGGARGVEHHRHLTRRGALRVFPDLNPKAFVGAIQYQDGQVDDARLTTMLARTAAVHGALLATSAEVTGFVRGDAGRVLGARVRNLETGEDLEVRSDVLVAATGVWTDDIHRLADVPPAFRVRMSKGIHIVVPRERIRSETGMILRTEKSVLFLIPWDRHWIIGTTDTDWELDRAHPAATSSDIEYLLARINGVLASPIERREVQGVYAGLRPLVGAAKGSTAKLSREHAIAEPAPHLFVIAGGKLTTYRVMARDVVDAAARRLDRTVARSETAALPILGAEGFEDAWERRHELAERHGLQVERVERLLRRYGSAIDEVLPEIARRSELARPIPGAEGYLLAEARHAATHEGALHLVDVLERRTRISFEAPDRGLTAAEPVAREVGPVLGWDETRVRLEIEQYRASVAAQLAAEQQPNDDAANRARLAAPAARDTVGA